MTLTKAQISKIIKHHNNVLKHLNYVVDGEVNASKPKPITKKDASCFIAKAINESTLLMMVLDIK